MYPNDDIFPSWSRVLPMAIRGLLFPPLAQFYRKLNSKTGAFHHLQTSIKYSFAALATTPNGHPSLAHYEQRLAASLFSRYKTSLDVKDLQLAYMLQVSALKSIPSTHPDINWQRESLQLTYRARYRLLGKPDDLERAISLSHLAISELPSTSTSLSWWQSNLAFAYHLRYERFRRTEDVEAEIQLALAAADAPSAGVDELHALGVAYSDKFNATKEPEFIDLALFWVHSAISKATDISTLTRMRQNLATFHSDRYRILANIEDLQTAIAIGHKIVDELPMDQHNEAAYFYNLSMYHSLRHEQLREAEDLEEAVKWAYKTADCQDGYQALYASQLAAAVYERYQVLGNLEDLESAIRWSEVAVLQTDESHIKAAWNRHRLSCVIHGRYRRHRRRDDLDLAFQWSKSAIALSLSDDPDLPDRQLHLSVLYHDLFSQSKDTNHLDTALQLQQAVIDATPPTHPRASDRYTNFSILHAAVYQAKGGLEHREATMHWNHAALDASKSDDPKRHVYLHSVALEHFNKYIRLKELADLDLSLMLSREALATIPHDHARVAKYYLVLADAHAERYNLLREVSDRDRALHYYHSAVESSNSNPSVLWEASRRWAIFTESHHLPESINAYRACYRILPELFWLGNDMKSRHETLVQYEVSSIAANAVAACVKHGNLECAVEFMEHSLTLTYQQLLDLRTDLSTLKDEFPGYASLLEKLSDELQKIASTSDDDRSSSVWDRQRKLAIERDVLLKAIRQLPAFQNFLLPVPYLSLVPAAQFGPIAMINCAGFKCDAILLLPAGRLIHVALPAVTLNIVMRECERLRVALRRCGIYTREIHAEDRAGRVAAPAGQDAVFVVNKVLSWIWESIVFPIFNALETHGVTGGRIWWCLTGPLTYLPLHAAGPPSAFIQSYTSTLGALIRARSVLIASDRVEVVAVGLSKVKAGTSARLPFVKQELEALHETVGDRASIFMNEDATFEAVSRLLPDSTWLHLACHGQQGDAQRPLKSGLLLYDGSKLELGKIITTSIPNADFVFLSACETAMGDVDMASESLHLAGGMIFAGFRAVIGTLWSINDSDGPVVARRVYLHLFKDGEPNVMHTAEALHLAVQDLRSRGVPPQRWVPFIHIGV